MNENAVGEGLASILSTQVAEADAVSYPEIEGHAQALSELCNQLGSPIVWPVGPAAERIAGAAELISRGDIRLRQWNSDVRGQQVLVFAAIELTPLALFAAAEQAMLLGAASVRACGIRVFGADEYGLEPFDGFHSLSERVLSGVGIN